MSIRRLGPAAPALTNRNENTGIPITEAAFPVPFPSRLEFNPPVHGTWNIVHIGMLLPQAHQIYVCSENCMRGVVMTAAESDITRLADVRGKTMAVVSGSDAQTELSYDLDEHDPKNAVARIRYLYDGRVIGTTWLRPDSEVRVDRSAEPSAADPAEAPGTVSPVESIRKLFADGDAAGRFLIILIGILIIGLLVGIVLLIRRILADRSGQEIRLSESLRRIQQNDSSFTQEGAFRDTSSSVDHYLPDNRSRRRSSQPFFRRKG